VTPAIAKEAGASKFMWMKIDTNPDTNAPEPQRTPANVKPLKTPHVRTPVNPYEPG
jgi:hypothetical protein